MAPGSGILAGKGSKKPENPGADLDGLLPEPNFDSKIFLAKSWAIMNSRSYGWQ